ncbi:hypothetical protein CYMTET_34619, partial [Cymbomonas tetramitiformis]
MVPRHTFLSGSNVERTNAGLSAWQKEEQIYTDDLSGIFFNGRRANFMVACSLLVVVLIIILTDESKVPQWTPPQKPQEQPSGNSTPASRFPVAVSKKDLEEFHREYFGHLNSSIRSAYGDGAYLEGYIPGPYAESHGSNLLLMPNGAARIPGPYAELHGSNLLLMPNGAAASQDPMRSRMAPTSCSCPT